MKLGTLLPVMPSLEPSITWLGGGAVSLTGAPTERLALPAPPCVPLGAKAATNSGLLVSVTYSVLPSESLSGSTRMPPSLETASLVARPGVAPELSSLDTSQTPPIPAALPSFAGSLRYRSPSSAMTADALLLFPATDFQNSASGFM